MLPENADDLDERIRCALDIAHRFGQVDEGHHKAWVIDQMVRELLGEDYEPWVRDYKSGEDGPETYSWETGIAP